MTPVLRAVREVRIHWQDPLYRNSYFLIANSAVLAGTGFLFWIAAARLATTEEVGIASTIVSALMLASVLAKLGFDVAFLRHMPGRERDRADALLNTGFFLTGVTAVLGGVVFALGVPIWAPSLVPYFDGFGEIAALGILAGIWTLGTLLDAVFTARGRAGLVLLKNTAHSVLKIAFLAALATFLGVQGIVFSLIGSMAIALAWGAYVGLPRVEAGWRFRPRIDRETLRETLTSCFANYAVSLILILPQAVASLLILERAGATEAARFYVLWMIGNLGMAAPLAFGQTQLVEMVEKGVPGRVLRGRAVAVTAMTSVGTLVAALLLLPLFGRSYEVGFWLVLPFALAPFPALVMYASLAAFRASGQNLRLVLAPTILVVVFVVGLIFAPATAGSVGWLWLAATSAGALACVGTHLRARP